VIPRREDDRDQVKLKKKAKARKPTAKGDGPQQQPRRAMPPADHNNGRTRAAVYMRVSSDKQSTENQKPDLDRMVQARDLDVVAVFEESVSAAKHRPAFEEMLRAAHRGEFRILVIWALDRFGRSMVGNLDAVLTLDRLGVTVISCRESWLDTDGPVRSLLIAIISWIGEQERNRIGERTRAGLDRARRKGTRLGRPQAHVNVSYARQLRAQGMSIREAARRLGVGSSTLHRILQDPEDQQEQPRVPKRVPRREAGKSPELREPAAVP
jgi:putative DNA-invertase from lambdoid prophage Rac